MKKLHHQKQSSQKSNDSIIRLSQKRNIFLAEDVTKDMAATTTGLLLYYDNISNDEITMFVNSNGGDVSALNNIHDIMQMIKSPVRTICINKAYSAAAVILAAGTKGRRFITNNGSVMIHGLQCSFPSFNSEKDSENYIKFLDGLNSNVINLVAMHCGHKPEKVLADCKRDFYLDAEAAIKYNIVDYIYKGNM